MINPPLVIDQQTRAEAEEGFEGKQDTENGQAYRQTYTQRDRKVPGDGSQNNTGSI